MECQTLAQGARTGLAIGGKFGAALVDENVTTKRAQVSVQLVSNLDLNTAEKLKNGVFAGCFDLQNKFTLGGVNMGDDAIFHDLSVDHCGPIERRMMSSAAFISSMGT